METKNLNIVLKNCIIEEHIREQATQELQGIRLQNHLLTQTITCRGEEIARLAEIIKAIPRNGNEEVEELKAANKLLILQRDNLKKRNDELEIDLSILQKIFKEKKDAEKKGEDEEG